MENRYNQTREKLAYYWPTYGPPVLGALLVLLALFVGYRILSNRGEQATTPQVQEDNLLLNLEGTPTPEQPGASVTLPARATPTPEQVPVGGTAQEDSESAATSSASTKGGQLPETGFPVVFAVPVFATLAFGGFKLSRVKK